MSSYFRHFNYLDMEVELDDSSSDATLPMATPPSSEEDHLLILPPPPVRRVRRKKRVEGQKVTFESCPLFPRILHKLFKVSNCNRDAVQLEETSSSNILSKSWLLSLPKTNKLLMVDILGEPFHRSKSHLKKDAIRENVIKIKRVNPERSAWSNRTVMVVVLSLQLRPPPPQLNFVNRVMLQ